jgi:hypothetical protein
MVAPFARAALVGLPSLALLAVAVCVPREDLSGLRVTI